MRILTVLVILVSIMALAGCSSEDKTVGAAPPPKADARPETMGGQPKAAPQNTTSSMQGAAVKPAGM
jgi:uncharacterized lipoprotein YajG